MDINSIQTNSKRVVKKTLSSFNIVIIFLQFFICFCSNSIRLHNFSQYLNRIQHKNNTSPLYYCSVVCKLFLSCEFLHFILQAHFQ